MITVHTRLRASSRGGLGRENIKLSPVSGGSDDDDDIDIDNEDSQLIIAQYLCHTNSSRRCQRIIIIRIFTQDNPSVHCTAINGVLHIELN